jgi:hypothetical protein
LRAQKIQLQNQLRAKQLELDVVKTDLECDKFPNEILKAVLTEG